MLFGRFFVGVKYSSDSDLPFTVHSVLLGLRGMEPRMGY